MKFSPDTISKLGALKADLVKLVAAINWVYGAVVTFQKIAEILGLGQGAQDQVLAELKKIGLIVDSLYGNELRKAKAAEYQQVEQWRQDAVHLRTELWNLAITRTDAKISNVDRVLGEYRKAIGLMLSDAYAKIPFIRSTYNYYETAYPVQGPEPHWVDYCHPFYMSRAGGEPPREVRMAREYKTGDSDLWTFLGFKNAPVELAWDPELKTDIWDPGYYLDVLIHFVTMWLSGLALLEPVYRSTGHRRPEILTLAKDLERFALNWREHLLVSAVDGPIDPGTTPYLNGTAHVLRNLFALMSANASGIPMAVVDPVSGVAATIPSFHDGFDTRWVPYGDPFSQGTFPGLGNGLYVLANYTAARASALGYQDGLKAHVVGACGVTTMQELAAHVRALAAVPQKSETTRIDTVDTRYGATNDAGATTVSLGLAARFADRSTDRYDARRWRRWNVAKAFRLPLARRMDSSRLQLGYALRVSIGDDVQEIELAPYGGPQDFANQQLPIFPTQPINVPVTGTTLVYDVFDEGVHRRAPLGLDAYASVPFNFDDEQRYENDATGNGRQRPATAMVPPPQPQGLAHRRGRVQLQHQAGRCRIRRLRRHRDLPRRTGHPVELPRSGRTRGDRDRQRRPSMATLG